MLWKTIERELLRAQDIETIVLKSHLLIETQLNLALESHFGSDITKARLSFFQKLEIVACIWPSLKNDKSSIGPRSLYEDCRDFNKLRNKIAHQLTPKDLRKSLSEWTTKALGYRLKTINRPQVLKRNIIKAIVFEVAYVSGFTRATNMISNI